MSTLISLWEKYDYVYINGIKGTLGLSAITVLVATVLGTIIALMRMSNIKIFNIFTSIYIAILRGTPTLLQLYFFWLLLPKVSPIELSDTISIVIALICNSSSYVAEIVRAGIQAIDIGQIEAAKSLGLRSYNIFRRIVLPQAVKNILPALGNEYIAMIKQTSLASVFFIGELTTAYKTVQSATFRPIEALIISGIIYFIIIASLTKVIQIYERRLQTND